MVRKRLTDLLREEIQKPDEAGETTPEAEAVDAAATKATETTEAIAQLKTTLEQTQQRETGLKDQVVGLQARLDELQTQLDEQKRLVKSLQTDLKRADMLKKDLEEARKDALQLAEANTKLAQEIEFLQKPPSPAATAIAKTTLSPSESRQRQARSLSHPVFPNEPLPSQGVGLDTGWMD